MKVLVTGANFVNQGAYLMLVTAVRELRERFDAQAVLDLRQGTERQKRAIAVDTLWTPKLARRFGYRGPGTVPAPLRDRLPYLLAGEIDAVLDVSGFRYGDQWAHLALADRAGYLAYWHRHGVPVVMMPQAFGPFATTGAPSLVALRSARLVVPREPESAGHVRDLLARTPGPGPEVLVSSDFTVGTRGRVPAGFGHLDGGVAIVPNWNIAERSGTAEGRAAYVGTLAAAVQHLRARGIAAYGLSHEGAKDVAVLREVATETGGLEIVEGLDGLQLKGLLGTARAAVGGRFHALVSAFSQGVPSVIHGWSHKYTWLARDFAAEDLLASPLDGPAPTLAALDRALDDPSVRADVEAAATKQKSQLDPLWDAVGRHLGA
jgi:colanic acid/amylovoran biosynthesis protein